MEHCARNGSHKILEEVSFFSKIFFNQKNLKCSLPLTGVKCVDKIITEMGVLEVSDAGMTLTEIWPEFTVDEVKAATGCECRDLLFVKISQNVVRFLMGHIYVICSSYSRLFNRVICSI